MKTVMVSAAALRQVLEAVLGPPHLIKELIVIKELNNKLKLEDENDPIGVLIREFNSALEEAPNEQTD